MVAWSYAGIFDARFSPDGQAVAYTTGDVDSETGWTQLLVCALEGKKEARLVASDVSFYADWAPTGRSVVYVKGAQPGRPDENARLGILCRRTINDMEEPSEETLAGLMFTAYTRVRCLRDGRILFTSLPISLPAASNDLPQREQLYALDVSRQATVTRLIPYGVEQQLPAFLSYFEVSPDSQRVAFAEPDSGRVVVFEIATGNVVSVQAQEMKGLKSVPSWRSPTQLTIVVPKIGEEDNDPSRDEVVVWSEGEQTVWLSRDWPAKVVEDFLGKAETPKEILRNMKEEGRPLKL